jgi:hypothetical protein
MIPEFWVGIETLVREETCQSSMLDLSFASTALKPPQLAFGEDDRKAH